MPNSCTSSTTLATPGYTLVGKTIVNIPASNSEQTYIVLDGNIEVAEGDIIGFQHESGSDVIVCDVSSTSLWRQDLVTIFLNSWSNSNNQINIPRNAVLEQNSLCQIQAVYSQPILVQAPLSVTHPSFTARGNHLCKVTVTNHVHMPSHNIDKVIEFQSPVYGFKLVHPDVQRDGILYVEAGVKQDLLWVVKYGSNLTMLWSENSSIFQFLDSCPSSVSYISECSETRYRYVSTEYTFPYIGEISKHKLTATTENNISTKSITSDVVAQIAIINITLFAPGSTQFTTNCSVTFNITLDTGSHMTYAWSITNDTTIDTTQPTFQYVVPSPGMYHLKINLFNALSSEIIVTDFVMYNLAQPKNLTLKHPNPILLGSSVTFQLTFTLHEMSSTEILVNYGDGDSAKIDGPYIDVRKSFSVNLQHLYSTAGIYSLNVTVIDKFQKEAQPDVNQLLAQGDASFFEQSITVCKKLEGGNLKTIPTSPMAVNTEVNFSVDFVQDTNDTTYIWSFNDGQPAIITNTSSLSKNVTQAGEFAVTVNISNGVSTIIRTSTLKVQEPVTGLKITYNGPNKIGNETVVTASVETGTSVMYLFTGDYVASSPQVSSIYRITYPHVGHYNITVQASNGVSSEVQTLTINIIHIDILNITDFVVSTDCVATGDTTEMTILITPPTAQIIWNFGDGSTETNKTMALHRYSTKGDYNVTVYVSNSISTITELQPLCVQDRIGNVDLTLPDDVLSLEHGHSVDGVFSISVSNGSDYMYQWNINQTITTIPATARYTVTFINPGLHLIILSVFNKINSVEINYTVQVVEVIKNVSMLINGTTEACNGYLQSSKTYVFGVTYGSGSGIEMKWVTTVVLRSSQSNDSQITLTNLQEGGLLWVNITIYNKVSTAALSQQYQVLAILQDVSISSYPDDSVIAQNQVVRYYATVANTNLVTYTWKICALSCIKLVTGGNSLVYNFTKSNTFTVNITVSNPVNLVSAETTVKVIQAIQNVQFKNYNADEDAYVPTGTVLNMTGLVSEGEEIVYNWTLTNPDGDEMEIVGEHISYTLSSPGTTNILLIASNLISRKFISMDIVAQDQIVGLELKALNGTISTPHTSMMFLATFIHGTDVEYEWNAYSQTCVGTTQSSNNNSELFTCMFNEVGKYIVVAKVHNQISHKQMQLLVTIEESFDGFCITSNSTYGVYLATDTPVQFTVQPANTTSFNSVYEFWWTSQGSSTHKYTNNDPNVVYSFSIAGVSEVRCNMTHGLSSIIMKKGIVVMEPISGTMLTSNMACIHIKMGSTVTFSATIPKGSEMHFTWMIDDVVLTRTDKTIDHQFSGLGNHTVYFTVSNQISSETVSMDVLVMEPITGLDIKDCCNEVLEMTEHQFTAIIATGTDVSYKWTIKHDTHCIHNISGKTIKYVFNTIGAYTMTLKAINRINEQTIVKSFHTQIVITDIEMVNEDEVYHGEIFMLEAKPQSGSNLTYQWEVASGLIPIKWTHIGTTPTNTLTYQIDECFATFWFRVNAYNNISKVSDKMRMHCTSLKCDVPKLTPIGGHYFEEYKSRTLHLEVNVDLNCTYPYKVVNEWKIYTNGPCSKKGNWNFLLSIFYPHWLDRPRLILPGSMLGYGRHCAVFQMSYDTTPMSVSVEIDVNITASELIAVISGGSTRTFSTDQDIILDGSVSKDPDNNKPDHTEYIWTCKPLVIQ